MVLKKKNKNSTLTKKNADSLRSPSLEFGTMVNMTATCREGVEGAGAWIDVAHHRDRVHVDISLGFFCFFLPPSRTSSLSCLLFTAEVKAIPLEQTVQLRGKKKIAIQCLCLYGCV